MRKGCLNVLAVLAVLGIATGGIYLRVDYWNNPIRHGKRLHSWLDQAIWAEDPAARREAVSVLLEVLPDIHDWPRTYLLMLCCHPEKDGKEKYPLPDELLPFLIAALKAGERPSAGYASIAMFVGRPPSAVPALEEALKDEQDPAVRERLKEVLRSLRRPAQDDALPDT
jgi:hypothetical protein